MSKEENLLKLYTSQREYVFRAIQIILDLSVQIEKNPNTSLISQFKSRFSKIENIREEYATLTEKINSLRLSLNPKDNIDMQAMSAFDDMYYEVLGVAAGLCPAPPGECAGPSAAGASGHASTADTEQVAHARLPQIELPKFDSKIENWQTFYDTFSTLIHNNSSIAPITKFHYLLSCLSGSALGIAKQVKVTSDNYELVFNELVKRYQNKRILAVTYLDQINKYPCLKNPNFNEFQTYTNILCESVNALKALKLDDLGDFILFNSAFRALDNNTRHRFECQNKSDIPTFQDLMQFLQDYAKVLETTFHSSNANEPLSVSTRLSQSYGGKQIKNVPPRSQNYKRSALISQSNHSKSLISLECYHCGAAHSIYKCPTFQSLGSQARLDIVKQKNLCVNCLRKHSLDKCVSKMKCFICGRNHHTLVHIDSNSSLATAAATGPSSSHANTSALLGQARDSCVVLLGTCVVRVQDAYGTLQTVRALIDSGAQDCFMTMSCVKKLGFQLSRCNTAVSGLGQHTVCQVRGVTQCSIRPCDSNDPQLTIKPIVIDSITSKMPTCEIPQTVRNYYKHLLLADRDFDKPSDVELLLGAEVFHHIYDGQKLKPEPGYPAALHSIFGWILSGPTNVASSQNSGATSLLASTSSIDEMVKRFWEVEEPPHTQISVPDDLEAERLYGNLTYRQTDGRYVVPILLKHPATHLGDSYFSSLSQFIHLEKRLSRQELLKSDYCEFMREYEKLNHMQAVDNIPTGKYFIPHHCVVRPESTTTKLRVVFNASHKTTNSLSLNDIVYTGPKLQADIVDVLTGFRIHNVVFTCDISKMYRQILIRPEDRAWQHVLWRESPSSPVQEFELLTVTYGVKSSPYLAIRTLHQLAADHGDQYPLAADALRHHTYMDDITTGASSVEAALQVKQELINLLHCAQLQLRKWSSNSSKFLEGLPVEHCQTPKSFCEDGAATLKVLGVQWDPTSDYFTYSVTPVDVEFTKRSILSNVARIYDPMGWLAPFILLAKLLLQNLWRIQVTWDELIPEELSKQWANFVSDLSHLKYVKIPRKMVTNVEAENQLIGFCDGSGKGYGCCVYLRSSIGDQVQVFLLIAKSKVAPIKPLTVNRLELCGATLLCRTLSHMQTFLSSNLKLSQVLAFSDSSTVLAWINTEPYKLKTFVAHRVVQICDTFDPSIWRHVSTEDNPADYASRGLSCAELVSCEKWWSGPEWLIRSPSFWPAPFKDEHTEDVPEMKTFSHLVQSNAPSDNICQLLLERCSSLTHLKRVLAWVFRFMSNAKNEAGKRVGSALTTEELDHSLLVLIKYVQQSSFAEDICKIKSNQCLPKHLQKLSPLLDDSGLVRVGGRLKIFNLPDHTKHPYLLPKESILSKLIITFYHKFYLHCGPRTLQSLIQRKFWILGIRNLIRSNLSKCVTCFKVKPSPFQPLMGNLPPCRAQQGHCFQNVGIDFGGPFLVKESRRRNARSTKAYVCLIVCLSVKAVHLELVSELSTEAFLAAFDRFVSRRGICRQIVTDCGTNFVGAKRYLHEMFQLMLDQKETISTQLTSRGISWKLNPPSSPHFGGIFESGIKSTKYHLKRVIGSQVLTFEELTTILTKVEAMLNSRPLCQLSSDPSEVDVLTPGHFIVGRPLVALPEPNLEDLNPRTRWQLLKRLSQQFWRVWQNEYLHTLQQKGKWFKDDQQRPEVGQIVTVQEPNLAPNQWCLGRIVKVHPGNDNIIRVVTVQTEKSLLKRPVVKICPLPLN